MSAAPGGLRGWLLDQAVPLWTGAGWDAATGTVWEALDHAGRPRRDLDRRLRVQARQAYAFATLARQPGVCPALAADLRARAEGLFDFVMTRGFAPGSGNLASWLAPDLTIRTAPHDLYDLSFVLLAAAGLAAAGTDVSAEIARLEGALDRLAAPRGWHECAARRLPRRQNPHMHLFEAMCALYRATGAPRFAARAATCRRLMAETFLGADLRLLEFYDAGLRPLTGADQREEPGHLVEWIALEAGWQALDLPEGAGRAPLPPPEAMFAAATAHLSPGGLLPDVAGQASFRLWPQSELLRAARLMQGAGADLPERLRPEAVLARIRAGYLETPVPGGWYDQRDGKGALVSDTMPASTFYHLVEAFLCHDSGRLAGLTPPAVDQTAKTLS
jgi:mannose/cellobiose epimerase-like protein (N-acyl-D-glucosamine 2-epimerase family)